MRKTANILTLIILFFVSGKFFAQLPGCATTVNTFPYNEGFETGVGTWNQNATEQFDWTPLTGGTGSGSTGPSAASEGTQYLYIETSSPRATGDEAWLESNCFDFTGVLPTIEFDYHMYGATMGSLELLISTNGTVWTSLWSMSGDQGNIWSTASINLSAYSGQTVGFRFRGVRGTSYTGDAAIDNITIFDCNPQGSCAGMPTFGNTDHITNVDINTINNTSGCSPYTDYTATSTNLNAGSSYVLEITTGGGLGLGVYTDCAGWVDWNNDGDFIDADETLSFYDNGVSGSKTAIVTVPAGTALGSKTMRLRSAQGGTSMTPCNTTANGETEDYTLNVNTNTTPTITASITQGTSATACLGDFLTLNAVPVSSSAITSYQWYFGNYSDSDIDDSIDASRNGVYSIVIENADGEAAIVTFTLTINDLPSGGVIGNYTWCQANDSVDVQLSLNGSGPFSVVIQPGSITYNNVSNGDLVKVLSTIQSPVSVYLSQITDANGCTVTLGNPVNEVVNGDGTTLTGWTITNNGGDGWLANGTFRTSYGWARKFQVIDLVAAGYTTAELDTAPIVYASEQYSSVFNNGDQYEYTVTLQDASFNTIDTKSITLTNVGSNNWQLAGFTFSNYGSGLRYIRYEHGGVDTEFWADHYGTRIDNSTITLNVKRNISAGSLDFNCPLPVELTNFETECDNSKTKLIWTTSSETNNDYFSIERSVDGVNFDVVDNVDGKGNSSNLTNYSWTDDNNSISNTVYYRLKQTDYNGNYKYIGLKAANCKSTADINLYPNPTNGKVTVDLGAPYLNVNAKVTNVFGQIIKSESFESISSLELLLDNVNGLYFVEITSNNRHLKTFKLLKQ